MLEFKEDYKKLFDNHLVVITGLARGGTSLMERLVGSMQDCFSLYEPVCFPNILTLIHEKILDDHHGKTLLMNILFEDMYLNVIQGRYVNFNPQDESYIGNYRNIEDVKNNWSFFRRRNDVMNWLDCNQHYKLVVKTPNLGPLLDKIDGLFLGVKFIIISRNLDDVKGSCRKKGFYNNDYMNVDCWNKYLGNDVEGDSLLIPYYINDDMFLAKSYDEQLDLINNTMQGYINKFIEHGYSNVYTCGLEHLREYPMFHVEQLERFLGVHRTCKTLDIVKSISSYKQEVYK